MRIGGTADFGNTNMIAGSQNQYIGGDFLIEYILTGDGQLKLQAYSRTEPNNILSIGQMRSGIGISFNKDFDNFKDLFKKDPNKNKDAKKHHEITYTDVLRDNLKVMDMAAIAVARENNLPIKVFSIKQRGNFAKVLKDQGEYTIIRGN